MWSQIKAFPRYPTVWVYAAFFIWLAIIQRIAGAPNAAFGGFPDESAHYMGGVVIRDYLAHAFGQDPLQFARSYYVHRPFFALGVWPPLFYVLEGCWMLLFGEQRSAIIWMMAAAGAGLATLFYWILKKEYDHWTGVAGAAMLLSVPIVQWSACLVMVDLTCSLFALTAVVFFSRFVERRRRLDALLFGFFCGLALLTKNSTYFVLLVPPIVIAAKRRWELLRDPGLWLAAGLVFVMYLPWLLISRSVLLLGIHGLELPGIVGIHWNYATTLWRQLSFLVPLGVAGAAWFLFSKREKKVLPLCLLTLIPALSLGIFAARVPVQERLMILAYVAIIFLAAECWTVAGRSWRPILMGATCVVFVSMNWMEFRKPPRDHIHNAVAFLQKRDANLPGAVLAPSDNEGPWIADFAATEGRGPIRTIVRPTKLFGEEDWNGSNWKSYYTTPDQVRALLNDAPVKYCIFSKSPSGRRYPHDELLEAVVAKDAENWRLVFTSQAEKEPPVRIYQNLHWRPESEQMVDVAVARVLEKHLR